MLMATVLTLMANVCRISILSVHSTSFVPNIQGLYAEGGLQRFVIDEAQLDSTSSEIQVEHRSHYDLGFRHCLSIWGNEFREP